MAATCVVRKSISKILALACILPLLTFSAPASAQDKYPSRPVRIIMPFPPGGSDVLARLMAGELTKRLGQSFMIDNIPGAGGTIGTAQAARAKPDGYTLVAGTPGPITISPVAAKGLAYDAERDLIPISIIAEGPPVVVVGKNSTYKSVREIIDAAKAKPQSLFFGSAGLGTYSHLNGELFSSLAGVQITHVPYKGSGPVLVDLIAGRIDLEVELFSTVQKLIESGELRALAVGSSKRYPLRPELPTISESGVPGFETAAWVSLMAPRGTPVEIVDLLQKTMATALTDPVVVKQINGLGMVPGGMSPSDFKKIIDRDRLQVKSLVEKTGLVLTY